MDKYKVACLFCHNYIRFASSKTEQQYMNITCKICNNYNIFYFKPFHILNAPIKQLNTNAIDSDTE